MSLAIQLCQLNFQSISSIQFAVIFCALLLLTSENTYGSRDINVVVMNGVYHIEGNIKLDVAAHYVRDALLDVAHIYRLNPSIIESEVIESKRSDEAWVRTRVLCCIPAFCREVERVDAISTLPSGEVQSKVIPAFSDFSSGKSSWKITSLDNSRTHLYLQANIEPKFYIPAIVGVQVVKKQFTITFERIKLITRINAERDSLNEHPPVHISVSEKNTPPKNFLSSQIR